MYSLHICISIMLIKVVSEYAVSGSIQALDMPIDQYDERSGSYCVYIKPPKVEKNKIFDIESNVYEFLHRSESGVGDLLINSYSNMEETGVEIDQDTQDPLYKVALVWFPGNSTLFSPLVADPRTLSTFAGYRFGDDVFGKHVASVSSRNSVNFVAIYYEEAAVQVELEAGLFAVFNISEPTHGHVADLQNADYFIGIPVTIQSGNISMRCRLYHISSHIGDDFISALMGFPGERIKQIEWGDKNIRQAIPPSSVMEIRNLTCPLLKLVQRLGMYEQQKKMLEMGSAEHWDLMDVLLSSMSRLSAEEQALVDKYKNLMLAWVFYNKPSFEVIDWFVSFQFRESLRFVVGAGLFIRNNPSIDQGKGFIQIGAEWRVIDPISIMDMLYTQMFSALNVAYNDMHCWTPNVTYVIGFEIFNYIGAANKVRVFFMYHQGFSESGMFRYGKDTSYLVGISYGA